MLTDYILPGTRIELKPSGDSWTYQEEEKKIHISEVYDVVSEDRIDVMMPLEHGKLVLFSLNRQIQQERLLHLVFSHSTIVNKGGAAYVFTKTRQEMVLYD